MNDQEAVAKANQILDEERLCPTVDYVANRQEFASDIATTFAPLELQRLRSPRHREVLENPRKWAFKSTNYNLLCALLSHVPNEARLAIVNAALLRMRSAPACSNSGQVAYPNWNGLSSELPLVAEFCLRTGARPDFFRALHEANPLAGHVMLLRQLGEIVALNFTVLSDDEYRLLDLSTSTLGASAREMCSGLRRGGNVLQTWPEVGTINIANWFHEIGSLTDDLREKCRKARYLYLKGSLLEGLNLEINQDKDAVQSHLQSLGFNESLSRSLDEAERLFHEGGSGFTLKASMGHLRSFLENLHKTAMPAIQSKFGGTPSAQWGAGLTYLRQNRVLSEAEERFVAGLYGLISDEAVHPLFSEREYARLARNVLIEYALLFLRKMEKLGVKLS